jgi:hypothetical protein
MGDLPLASGRLGIDRKGLFMAPSAHDASSYDCLYVLRGRNDVRLRDNSRPRRRIGRAIRRRVRLHA